MINRNKAKRIFALPIIKSAVFLILVAGLLNSLSACSFGDTTVLSLLGYTIAPSVIPSLTPPSSQQIAFSSYFEGKRIAIYTMNADGSNLQRLANGDANNFGPTWSPDGQRIAFASDRDSPDDAIPAVAEIYVMDFDGGNQHRLTNNNFDDFAPAWSPNGQTIAFVSDRDGKHRIYLMDADGTNQHSLTYGNYPSWSPDGESIIFASDRSGYLEIYTIEADGSHIRQLTHYKGSLDPFDPSWSPTGRSIVFSAGQMQEGSFAIYVMEANGENQRALTPINGGMYPTWSPDGRFIAFTANTGGEIKIHIMNSDGSDIRPISPIGSDRPAWRPPGS